MTESATVLAEFARRGTIWKYLTNNFGSPPQVPATELRDCRVFRGQQGIWRDLENTKEIVAHDFGITVSVMHKVGRYSDELTPDGIDYHYPVTQRPANTDEAEIAATKCASELGLPIFVITDGQMGVGAELRTVQIGAVRGANESIQRFFIEFLDEWPSTLIPALHEPFKPDAPLQKTSTPRGQAAGNRLPHHARLFRFQVIEYYGAQCSVCDIAIADLLEASHLIPRRAQGSDDPRNGLVLCANHRKAFDLGLFAVHPDDLTVKIRAGFDGQTLKLTKTTLAILAQKPHPDALRWRFKHWERQ